MAGFFTIFKKHGFKLWLANLIGSITTFILFFIAFFFFGIVAAMFVVSSAFGVNLTDPLSLLQTDIQYQLMELISNASFGLFILFLLFMAVIALICAFPIGGGIGQTAEAVANDRSGIGSYFKYGFKSIGKMFGFFFLSAIIFFVFSFILITFVGVSLVNAPDESLGFVMIISFLVFLVIYSMVTLNTPIIAIVEQTGIFKAFGLSFRLLGNAFGKVLVTILWLIGLSVLLYLVSIPFMPEAPPIGMPYDPYGNTDPYSYTTQNSSSELGLFFFDIVVIPIYVVLAQLIVVYRYFKYMRPHIRPDYPQGGYPNHQQQNPYQQQPYQQPPFVFNPNQPNFPNHHQNQGPFYQPPNQQPPFHS